MIVGFFIGANLGFVIGCCYASAAVRRQMFEAARERGRLP